LTGAWQWQNPRTSAGDKETEGKWLLVPALPQPQPGGFYATRISSHVAWMESVLSETVLVDSIPVAQLGYETATVN
jgi:hypothetical protein